MTRARLLGTGLPAPFERDPRSSSERRGVHGAIEGERPTRAPPSEDAEAPDPDVDEVPADDPEASPRVAGRDTVAVTDIAKFWPVTLDIEHVFT